MNQHSNPQKQNLTKVSNFTELRQTYYHSHTQNTTNPHIKHKKSTYAIISNIRKNKRATSNKGEASKESTASTVRMKSSNKEWIG